MLLGALKDQEQQAAADFTSKCVEMTATSENKFKKALKKIKLVPNMAEDRETEEKDMYLY